MSLSMPTTRWPSRPKWRTVSAPIRPAEPVTRTVAMGRAESLGEDGFEVAAVVDDPARDLLHDRRGRDARLPAGRGRHLATVAEVADEVLRAVLAHRVDGDAVAGVLAAQRGQLLQRDADFRAAADVEHLAVEPVELQELHLQQVEQVLNVQQATHLLAGAAVADVRELAAEHVPGH